MHLADPQHAEDRGFTLIELLVVIVIIGILAAIAIPVFLRQRDKAYDAAAKADLNQLAQFEEAYLTSHSRYGTIAELTTDGMNVGPSHGDTLWVVRYDGAASYCLKAKATASPNTWFYDSAGGGLQKLGVTDCSATLSGTVGDSRTG